MLVEEFDEIAKSDVTVYIPSIDEPSICPEGTHVMSMIAPSKKKLTPRAASNPEEL
jgi:prolycopene isomerase